jgi:hypothetical protein
LQLRVCGRKYKAVIGRQLWARVGRSCILPLRSLQAVLSHSGSVDGVAAAITTGHSTDSDSYGRCTAETGHSICRAGDPSMNDRSDAERTGTADPLLPFILAIPTPQSGHGTTMMRSYRSSWHGPPARVATTCRSVYGLLDRAVAIIFGSDVIGCLPFT